MVVNERMKGINHSVFMVIFSSLLLIGLLPLLFNSINMHLVDENTTLDIHKLSGRSRSFSKLLFYFSVFLSVSQVQICLLVLKQTNSTTCIFCMLPQIWCKRNTPMQILHPNLSTSRGLSDQGVLIKDWSIIQIRTSFLPLPKSCWITERTVVLI